MSNDSLDKEIEAALEGVDLQGLGRSAEEDAPSQSGRGRDDLMPGTVSGISGDDVIVDLAGGKTAVGLLQERQNRPKPTIAPPKTQAEDSESESPEPAAEEAGAE